MCILHASFQKEQSKTLKINQYRISSYRYHPQNVADVQVVWFMKMKTYAYKNY